MPRYWNDYPGRKARREQLKRERGGEPKKSSLKKPGWRIKDGSETPPSLLQEWVDLARDHNPDPGIRQPSILKKALENAPSEYGDWGSHQSVLHTRCRQQHVNFMQHLMLGLYGDPGLVEVLRELNKAGPGWREMSQNFTVIWELCPVGPDVGEESYRRVRESTASLKKALLEVSESCRFEEDVGKWNLPPKKGQHALNAMCAAVELEIVDINRFKINSSASESDQETKGQRLESWWMQQREVRGERGLDSDSIEGSHCMVHAHGAIFGTFGGDSGREFYRRLVQAVLDHSGFDHTAVEVKWWTRIWKGEVKTLRSNLDHWAAYSVKGGNEGLKFNSRWGRSLENIMGDEDFQDDDRLSQSQIRWLHRAYVELQKSSEMNGFDCGVGCWWRAAKEDMSWHESGKDYDWSTGNLGSWRPVV